MSTILHHSMAKYFVQTCRLALLFLLSSCGGGGDSQTISGDDPTPPDDPPVSAEAVCKGEGTPPANPVLYLSDGDGVPPTNLYLVNADNPEAGSFVVNAPLTAQQTIRAYALSPDNRCVVYISDERIAGRFELYSVDLAVPGISARLNPALSQEQDVESVVFSPDARQVMYTADQNENDRTELFLVDLDRPGDSVRVNPELVINGDVSDKDIAYSPDGSQLLYAADQRTNGIFEIFLVDREVPGVAQVVNGPFTESVNLSIGLGFSPDGNWVGYVADQSIDDVKEMYVVDVSSPGNSIKMNPPYGGETDICSFKFRPDSQAVAYCADQNTDNKLEIYEVLIDAPGISARVNSSIVDGGQVRNNFQYSPTSDYIVYIADQEIDAVDELYRVEIASPGVSEKISDTLVAGGDVDLFEIRPDSKAVAYVADQQTDDVFELYQFSLDATDGSPLKMNSLHRGRDLFPITYSTDSTSLFYIADEAVADRHQLYKVDVDNPGVSTRLNLLLIAGGEVTDFVIPR